MLHRYHPSVSAMSYSLIISSMGIVVCMITMLFATDLFPIKSLFCFAIRIRSLRFWNRELSKIGTFSFVLQLACGLDLQLATPRNIILAMLTVECRTGRFLQERCFNKCDFWFGSRIQICHHSHICNCHCCLCELQPGCYVWNCCGCFGNVKHYCHRSNN